MKTAAAAMIGKSLALAMQRDPVSFCEESVEFLGDDELLLKLMASESEAAAGIAARYRDRRLYKPVFRAKVMQGTTVSLDSYKERQARLERDGLLDPIRRLDIEREIAVAAGVKPRDIIIYASKRAPGAKSVSQRVEQARGDVELRDSTYERHREIFFRHLGLWNLYLFGSPELPSEDRSRLSGVMRSRFQLRDELAVKRKQLALDL